METEYLNLARTILARGEVSDNRTGVKTIGIFGYQMRTDLSTGRFPLLTTKKVNFNAVVAELLWFIAGDTNAGTLIRQGVNIWNEWTPAYKRGGMEEVRRVFEREPDHHDLNLGPVYGYQWRHFGGQIATGTFGGNDYAHVDEGVDQLKQLVERIKTNPSCRRLILSAWNPMDIPDMALPPCHVMSQFRVQNGKLHCQLYQRSADLFLGVPFNIASYALLTVLLAKTLDLQPGDFIHTFGDVHIYSTHIEQIKEQLSRTPRTPPALAFKRIPDSIFDARLEDIELIEYDPHPAIRGAVAV